MISPICWQRCADGMWLRQWYDRRGRYVSSAVHYDYELSRPWSITTRANHAEPGRAMRYWLTDCRAVTASHEEAQ